MQIYTVEGVAGFYTVLLGPASYQAKCNKSKFSTKTKLRSEGGGILLVQVYRLEYPMAGMFTTEHQQFGSHLRAKRPNRALAFLPPKHVTLEL